MYHQLYFVFFMVIEALNKQCFGRLYHHLHIVWDKSCLFKVIKKNQSITERPIFLLYFICPYLKGSLPVALSDCERLPSNSSYTEKKMLRRALFYKLLCHHFWGYGEKSSPWRSDHSPLLKASKLSSEVVRPRLAATWCEQIPEPLYIIP